MKTKLFALGLALAGLVAGVFGAPAAAEGAEGELNALVGRIQEKLRAGRNSAVELAPELVAFDALRAKYGETAPEFAAKATRLEYSLCTEVLHDQVKATALRSELAAKYRAYLDGTNVGREIAARERMQKMQEAQQALVGKPAPELTFRWSTRPELNKLSDLRGKVVVLDFWATWCGPCVATFPQIRELVEHYQNTDVVVIGVTSLQGFVAGLQPPRIETKEPEKEFALTSDFIKAKNMTWTVAFSDQRVFNEDYAVTGIPHMTIIAPDGTVRRNDLHPGMADVEKFGIIDAILKEFKRPAAASPSSQTSLP